MLPGVKLTLGGHDTETADGADRLRLTAPERPNRLEKVRLPVPEDPVGKETIGVVVVIPKSVILTLRTMEWLKGPLILEKVTLYCPAGPPVHVGYWVP